MQRSVGIRISRRLNPRQQMSHGYTRMKHGYSEQTFYLVRENPCPSVAKLSSLPIQTGRLQVQDEGSEASHRGIRRPAVFDQLDQLGCSQEFIHRDAGLPERQRASDAGVVAAAEGEVRIRAA